MCHILPYYFISHTLTTHTLITSPLTYSNPCHFISHIHNLNYFMLSCTYPNHKHWYTHTHILIISCLKHIPHATIRISHTHTHLTTVCHIILQLCTALLLHFSYIYPNYFISYTYVLIISSPLISHIYCPITSFLIHIP